MAVVLGRKPGGGGSGAPSGPAGGGLAGTYPNPTIGNDAVDSAQIVANAVGASEIASGAVGRSELATGIAVMDLISDSTLGANAASFDLTSIAATFKHLRILLVCRSARAAQTEDPLRMTFNNDTGNNYDAQSLQAFGDGTPGTVINATEDMAAASLFSVGTMPAASSPAGASAQVVIDILNYVGTTFNKSFTSQCAAKLTDSTAGIRQWAGAGQWRSTAAITRVTLFPANANFLAGSRCSLYGIN